MTGIQALEQAAASSPMKRIMSNGASSKTSGTARKALVAAFDVATGQVCGTVGNSRTETDYVAFLEQLFATGASRTGWHVIRDNLNTHLSEGVVPAGGPTSEATRSLHRPQASVATGSSAKCATRGRATGVPQ
jgi:hypothetical protein